MAGPPGAAAGVRISVLVTGVQTGPSALVVAGALAATVLLYLVGVRRLALRSRRWAPARTAAFACGTFAVWVAVCSGMASYDESSVTAHVVQHVLLMMIAPPLLAMGRPLVLAAQAADRPVQVRLTRALRSRFLSALTQPAVASAAYFSVMYGVLVDRGVYRYLDAHRAVHDASHAVMLVVGLLYWDALVGAAVQRMRPGTKVLVLLASMPLEAFAGLWLLVSTTPIDAANTLSDTRRAGAWFLMLALLSGGVWTVAVCWQWYQQIVREDRRVSERSAAQGWAWTVAPWLAASASSGSLVPGPLSPPQEHRFAAGRECPAPGGGDGSAPAGTSR